MGSHIVILNSIKAGHELLEKRSTIYSDRYGGRISCLYHLLTEHASQTTHGRRAESVGLTGFSLSCSDHTPRIGMDWHIAFVPYGPTWRHLRREFHITFLPTKLEAFRPFEQRAVHHLLRNLFASPDNFSQHLRQCVGLRSSFGVVC